MWLQRKKKVLFGFSWNVLLKIKLKLRYNRTLIILLTVILGYIRRNVVWGTVPGVLRKVH